MSEVPSRNHRRVRLQAIVLAVVIVASALEILALATGADAARDALLGLVAVAMAAEVIGDR